MAAYPSFEWQQQGSDVERDAGLRADRASNGQLKVRKLFAGTKRAFNLTHWLTDAQKATLETFYGTNELLNVELTAKDDGVLYTVRFVAPPQYEWRGVNWWQARVRLLEA